MVNHVSSKVSGIKCQGPERTLFRELCVGFSLNFYYNVEFFSNNGDLYYNTCCYKSSVYAIIAYWNTSLLILVFQFYLA